MRLKLKNIYIAMGVFFFLRSGEERRILKEEFRNSFYREIILGFKEYDNLIAYRTIISSCLYKMILDMRFTIHYFMFDVIKYQ